MQGYIYCNTYDLRRENPCVSGEKKEPRDRDCSIFPGGGAERLGFRGKITSSPLSRTLQLRNSPKIRYTGWLLSSDGEGRLPTKVGQKAITRRCGGSE